MPGATTLASPPSSRGALSVARGGGTRPRVALNAPPESPSSQEKVWRATVGLLSSMLRNGPSAIRSRTATTRMRSRSSRKLSRRSTASFRGMRTKPKTSRGGVPENAQDRAEPPDRYVLDRIRSRPEVPRRLEPAGGARGASNKTLLEIFKDDPPAACGATIHDNVQYKGYHLDSTVEDVRREALATNELVNEIIDAYNAFLKRTRTTCPTPPSTREVNERRTREGTERSSRWMNSSRTFRRTSATT